MTLFPLDPEPANTNKELSLLSKRHPELDSVYLNVHMRKDWEGIKDFLDAEWVEFKKFADNDFPSQFQKKFSERSWEIYLFHLLRTKDFNLLSQQKDKPNPDFKIALTERNLFVEAVIAGKGVEANKVETISDLLSAVPLGTIVTRGGHIDDSNHPKVRRILNALSVKIKNYHDKHKNIIEPNDYYVIAVSGGDIEGDMSGEDLILEAVAGVNPAVHFPLKCNGTLGPGYRTLRKAISNSSGSAKIDLAVFDQEEFRELSAIIYFGRSVYNAILQELANEIVIVHNPNAMESKKIDVDVFSCFRQIIQVPEGWKHIQPTT